MVVNLLLSTTDPECSTVGYKDDTERKNKNSAFSFVKRQKKCTNKEEDMDETALRDS